MYKPSDTSRKKRRHIGIVFPSLDITQKFNLHYGISDFAIKNDIHISAYFGTYEANNIELATHYQPSFEVIKNSTSLDGVVLFSGFVANDIGIDEFIQYVQTIPSRIPLVSVGLSIPGIPSVMIDNTLGMYNIINHLINIHGKKRIAFIKGMDGHTEAEQRLSGYMRALKDNGIAFDEKLLLPGNFSPSSGRRAMVELIDNRKADFDAVAACADEMAFGAMEVLRQRGLAIPDKIAVTGFDDVEEAGHHDPPLSTVRQDFSMLGYTAIELLYEMDIKATEEREVFSNGLHSEGVIKDDKYLVPESIVRSSCGCMDSENSINKPAFEIRDDILRRRRVMDNIVLQFNVDALINELHKSLPIISINSLLVGLYKSPIVEGAPVSDRSIHSLVGFSGKNKISFIEDRTNRYPFYDYSSIADFDMARERQTLFFLPLIFVEEESGVMLVSYDDTIPLASYETLRRNISTAVKGASLIDKIKLLSITDELTGLLNRRGFFQHVYSRITHLKREEGLLPVVLAIDMDGLKHINDTYGHSEGDAALLCLSRLLKEALREEDIIGRLGGDEFVVFSLIKSEENIEKPIGRIREKLDTYNAKKLHPYDVTASIGAVIIEEKSREGFDKAMLSADDSMYDEKARKRAQGLTRKD